MLLMKNNSDSAYQKMNTQLHDILRVPRGLGLCCLLFLSSFWHKAELSILYEIHECEQEIQADKRCSNFDNFGT